MNNIRLANGDPGCRVQDVEDRGFHRGHLGHVRAARVSVVDRGPARCRAGQPQPAEADGAGVPGQGLEPDDLIEAWTSFFGTSARVYLDLFDDISARAVSGTYCTRTGWPTGPGCGHGSAKDWVKAWTYGLEKLPEVTGQGGTHGLDLRPPPVTRPRRPRRPRRPPRSPGTQPATTSPPLRRPRRRLRSLRGSTTWSSPARGSARTARRSPPT